MNNCPGCQEPVTLRYCNEEKRDIACCDKCGWTEEDGDNYHPPKRICKKEGCPNELTKKQTTYCSVPCAQADMKGLGGRFSNHPWRKTWKQY